MTLNEFKTEFLDKVLFAIDTAKEDLEDSDELFEMEQDNDYDYKDWMLFLEERGYL